MDLQGALNRIQIIDRRHRNGVHLGPCWEWHGRMDGKGYGQVYCGPPGNVIAARTGAHRFVYELMVGPVPGGLELDRLCRNIICCNPQHLEPVSHAENRARAKLAACRRGHPFTPENTYIHPDRPGNRLCRACQALTARERRAGRSTRPKRPDRP